jgi:hypothetical protein
MRIAIATGYGTAIKFVTSHKGPYQMTTDMHSADTFDTEAEANSVIQKLPLPIKQRQPRIVTLSKQFKP